MIFSIPVAWLQLARQKNRFLAALAGIAFIVTLMFMQLGFQDALYSSATQVHRSLKADLFLISEQYNSLTSQQSFPRNRLYQSLGLNGVESVSPVYVQFAKFKNPQTGKKYPIYVLGIDPSQPVFTLPSVNKNIDVLKLSDQVLFDQASRAEFGPVVQTFRSGAPTDVEIFPYNEKVGYRVRVGGLFSLGPSFGVDGNLVVNYGTLLTIFKDRVARNIDIGLVNLKPGVNPQKMAARLATYLPDDVRVFSRQDFIDFEKRYWNVRTPIGFIFSLMVTMGFVIGIVVVYQILYTNIASHLVAFATLKAMGFRENYLLKVVFQQAFFLAIMGFIPGLIIAFGLYDLAGNATRLPIAMTKGKTVVVLISTIVMCFISGFFSIRKLKSTEPAEVIF
jgi:putative ABC transport system permease protein